MAGTYDIDVEGARWRWGSASMRPDLVKDKGGARRETRMAEADAGEVQRRCLTLP